MMLAAGAADPRAWYMEHASPSAAWGQGMHVERMVSPPRAGAPGGIEIGVSPYALSPGGRGGPYSNPNREWWSQNTATPSRGLNSVRGGGFPRTPGGGVPPSGHVPPVDIAFLIEAQEQHRSGYPSTPGPRPLSPGSIARSPPGRPLAKEIATQTATDVQTQTHAYAQGQPQPSYAALPPVPAQPSPHHRPAPLGTPAAAPFPRTVVAVDPPESEWGDVGAGDITTVWALYQRYANAKTEGREQEAEGIVEHNNVSVRRNQHYASRASSPSASPRVGARPRTPQSLKSALRASHHTEPLSRASPHRTVEDVVRAYSSPRGSDRMDPQDTLPSPHRLPRPQIAHEGPEDDRAPPSPSPEPNYPTEGLRRQMPPSPIVGKAPSPRVGMLGRWRDHRGAVFVLAQAKLAVWELLFVLPETEEVLTVHEATWAASPAPHSRTPAKPRTLQMDSTGALLQAASLPILTLNRIVAYDSRQNWLTFEFAAKDPPKIKLRFESADGKRSTTCSLYPLVEE
eukprot:TRINITY_DN20307_c0_g1_i1.p1 TRINITY_DN20307_c0_g1~~TRINITY_DN20307_c0_g1_i1.p1  ORF type:complete len:512 (+),score=142.81 TRINITY_DN20307_c0_g1_i1:86-1621(+)